MEVLNFISCILLLIGILLFCIPKIYYRKNVNFPTGCKEKNPRFGILIPARNESKVIRGLLESIQKQTYPIRMEDVYVIVESKNDPTVQITEELGANIIVRKKLHLKRKGYALDEGLKDILKQGKRYDAYFIFDADNVLSEMYFEEMLHTYLLGYDIGVGYRNSKNGNFNVISASSTLTFSMINTLGNEAKNRSFANVIVSGTGFFIRGKWIEKWKGYPFHSLTEDYELYLYSVLHEMTSYYNTKAVFYDEQPTSFRQTIHQRTRWVKGFFQARKNYISKIKKSISPKSKNIGSKINEYIGIKPYLFLVAGALLLIFGNLIAGISVHHAFSIMKNPYYIRVFQLLFLIYFILVLFTGLLLQKEKNLNLNRKAKIKALFYNPIFLASYIYCVGQAVLKKEIEWVPIEHTEKEIQ